MKSVFSMLTLGVMLVLVPRAWPSEPTAEQEKAIAEIKKLGGSVVAVTDESGKTLLSVRLGGPIFGSIKVTDAGLEHLKGLTNIRELSLFQTEVTDAGFEHLKGLTNLSRLDLYHTQVTGEGLKHLKGLTKLSRLRLVSRKLSDEGLEHIKGLTSLSSVELVGTRITDAGLEHLKGLNNLSHLELCRTQVTEVGIIKVLEALPKLQRVSIQDLHGRGLEGLSSLEVRFESLGSGASLPTPPKRPPQSAEGGSASKLEGDGTRWDDKATGKSLRQKLSEWGNFLRKVENFDLNCWAISPDGKLVATGAGYRRGRDDSTSIGSISVWEVATSRRLAKYPRQGLRSKEVGSVEYVAFSEDGKTVYYRARPYELDGK